MTPSRIAYVVNVFPKLSETFIAGELAELRRRGIELRIFSLRKPTETMRHEMIARAGLDRILCDESEQFPTLLRDFQPELLHAHFATEPAAAARDFAANLGVPFTFTAHGYDIRRRPPADFAARAKAARAVVTVSDSNARYIVETFGVPRDRIRVIPCGIDTEMFRPRKSDNGLRSSPLSVPLIVCVARHVKVKNLGLLLETCALLRERGVSFRCVLVGDGPLRHELEQTRQRLALEKLVEFTGALTQDEVAQWWRQANVAVLTSENEGMPVSLMEAAACAVPAVAPAVGGIPELIEHEKTGLLSPPGDTLAFAAALQRLLEDSAVAVAMGQSARRRAEERFSLARQVDALLALWTEVLR